MRLLFAGTPDVAVPSLEALLAKHDVAAVLTRPDARSGRGRTLTPSPVRVAAEARGVPVITDRPRSEGFAQTIRALDVECAVVVAYGEILRRPVLDAVPEGWINVHFSLLPAWRGAAPVQRAVLAGDEITGVSTFRLEEGLDSGPVYGTMTEPVRARDTSGDLLGRLSEACVPLLLGTLDAIAEGSAHPVAQRAEGVSLAPKLTPDDARVRWEHPALSTDRRVRACTPAPGAWTTLPDGSRLGIGPVRPRPDVTDLAPGELRSAKSEVLVGTGTHAVELGRVSPVGKRHLVAADWARGARIPDGSLLGAQSRDGAA